MKTKHNKSVGTLFRNRKTKERSPDMTGQLQYDLNNWQNKFVAAKKSLSRMWRFGFTRVTTIMAKVHMRVCSSHRHFAKPRNLSETNRLSPDEFFLRSSRRR
jgi:hypothetical protein